MVLPLRFDLGRSLEKIDFFIAQDLVHFGTTAIITIQSPPTQYSSYVMYCSVAIEMRKNVASLHQLLKVLFMPVEGV